MKHRIYLICSLALLMPASAAFFLLVTMREVDMMAALTPLRAAQMLGLGPKFNKDGDLKVPWDRNSSANYQLPALLQRIVSSLDHIDSAILSTQKPPPRKNIAPQAPVQNDSLLDHLASSLDRLEILFKSFQTPPPISAPKLHSQESQNTSLKRTTTTAVSSGSGRSPFPPAGQRYRDRWPLQRNVTADEALTWRPSRKGKYVLALCTYGRMSNKRKCLQTYMVAAAVTNRTLVIPTWSERFGGGGGTGEEFYRFELALNASFARQCLGGAHSVVSEGEYRSELGLGPNADIVVDMYLCPRDVHCPDPRSVEAGFEKTRLKLPDRQWMDRTGLRGGEVEASALARASGEERLVTFGDLFGAGIVRGHKRFPLTPYGPFNMTCHMLMRPHDAIVRAARGFVEAFIGEEYMAIHLRRGDFFARGPNMYYSILEAVRCLSEGVSAESNISTIFVATDATEMEVDIMRRRLANHQTGRSFTVLTFPKLANRSREWRWANDWNRLNLDDDRALAVPTAEKLVSAMATVFRGSSASTFTEDIWTMRVALGLDTDLDADICYGRNHKAIPLIDR